MVKIQRATLYVMYLGWLFDMRFKRRLEMILHHHYLWVKGAACKVDRLQTLLAVVDALLLGRREKSYIHEQLHNFSTSSEYDVLHVPSDNMH